MTHFVVHVYNITLDTINGAKAYLCYRSLLEHLLV